MPSELRAELESLAAASKRSLNAEIVARLEQTIHDKEVPTVTRVDGEEFINDLADTLRRHRAVHERAFAVVRHLLAETVVSMYKELPAESRARFKWGERMALAALQEGVPDLEEALVEAQPGREKEAAFIAAAIRNSPGELGYVPPDKAPRSTKKPSLRRTR